MCAKPAAPVSDEKSTADNTNGHANTPPKVDPLKDMLARFNRAADILGLGHHERAILSVPEKIHFCNLPVTMDDGRTEVFEGFRVIHSTALGPSKGGIRYSLHVDQNEVMALAAWMTWKNGAVGIPYGGGKGGIKCDPRAMSEGELERMTRAYTNAMIEVFGPDLDIPAPDMGSSSREMAWIVSQFSRLMGGKFIPAMITGKPLEMGGSKGRVEATGRSVMTTSIAAMKKLGMNPQGATCAVQGFGNVGSNAAKLLSQQGVKVVAISDHTSAYYNPNGILVHQAIAYAQQNGGMLKGYKDAEEISNEELLELKVDVLAPCAIEGVITSHNASKINAKIISEGANGPTTADADDLLEKKGILVVPDIIANAGGVTCSYFEWVQNRRGHYWTENEVNDRVDAIINQAFEDAYQSKEVHKVTMRTGAYLVGVNKVATGLRLRGRY